MSKKKKIIIVSLIIVVAVAALVISALRAQKSPEKAPEAPVAETTVTTPPEEKTTEEKKPEATEQAKEEAKENKETAKTDEKTKVVEPEHNINVMYLISNSNENKDALLKMAEELRKEYETKVYFTVMNIDEDEMGANFALPDETPKLVMFGENNLFEMKNNCADKEELKQIIDSAINK